MNKETKGERFVRMSEARKAKFTDIMRLFGNLSNSQVYDYSEEQVDELVGYMHSKVDELENVLKHRGGFKLD